jgi:hypothetical protein
MESPQKGEVENEKVQNILEKLEVAEISKYGEQSNLGTVPSLEVFLALKDWQEKVTKKHLAFGSVNENLQSVKNADYSTVVWTDGALQKQLEGALSELKPKATTSAPAKK